jgi:hypothetical protein
VTDKLPLVQWVPFEGGLPQESTYRRPADMLAKNLLERSYDEEMARRALARERIEALVDAAWEKNRWGY